MVGVAAEDRHVADLLAALDAHEVNRAERAARVGDRPREIRKSSRPIVEMRANGGAE
jgi:hypothetical protein